MIMVVVVVSDMVLCEDSRPETPPLLHQLGSKPFGSATLVEGRPAGSLWKSPPSLCRETGRENETTMRLTNGTTCLAARCAVRWKGCGLDVLCVSHACIYVCACATCGVCKCSVPVIVGCIFKARHGSTRNDTVLQSVQDCASIQCKLHMSLLVARSLGDKGWNKHWLRGS